MRSVLLHTIKNGVLVAILAQTLIGFSLVWDKVLLNNPGTKNLFSYVFWLPLALLSRALSSSA